MSRRVRTAIAAALSCVVISSRLTAQRGPAPDPLVKENATVKVAAHTYVIPDGDVPLVPNVGIVVGSRATLVVDPGLGRKNGETVLREVAKVSKNADLYIVSTHFHAEHTTGYLAFPASAKYVNSNVQEAEFAQGGAQLIATFSGRSPATAELLKDATGRKADITFDRDYVLDLGGVRVRMLVVGPTHTRGDTGFFVEGDGVLFAGDVVMNNSFLAATSASSMRAWLAAFDAFEAMRPATIVPSHGAVGPAALIGANRSLMQEIQSRARELKAQGKSADETATTIQTEMQAKHPGWPRANGLPAAARAAYAEAPAPGGAVPAGDLPALTVESASNFARITLACVSKEYPNSPGYVLNSAADVQPPATVHPAFYGCYDWHSSVHGHWMLARLLRLYPALPERDQITKVLDKNLTAENIQAEAAYFKRPGTQAFERTYGWAWTLKLAQELHLSPAADAKRWARNLQPLADALVQRYLDFLPKQTYAIRTGLHPNTAFGLAFALDYASAVGNTALKEMVAARSRDYFEGDAAYPAQLEPNGSDFLSPALVEADLMRRVLSPPQFAAWFHNYLPQLGGGEPKNLLAIAVVTDRSDPQLGHLDGLNLSRAWCMRHVAAALPGGDPARAVLAAAGRTHALDALQHVATGHYEGEHWLASFAVYLLTEPYPTLP